MAADNEQLVEIKTLMDKCINEINSYIEKPTKTKSLNIRKMTTSIGKSGTFLRAELIALDKAGY
jgi:hypothetical protein